MKNLRLQNIVKRFNGLVAVNKVSLDFHEGFIYSIVGPNGAGKTTLFNIISGFLTADSGDIYLGTSEITSLEPWKRSENGIGRLFQDIRIYRQLTAIENIVIGMQNSYEGILESIFNRKKIRQQELTNIERALKALETFGLIDNSNKLADSLSYGQQKLLGLARLMMGDYHILLLDEPAAGINIQNYSLIKSHIISMKSQGKIVIIIEHNIKFVEDISDYVFFMHEGKIIDYGTPVEVFSKHIIKDIYLGR